MTRIETSEHYGGEVAINFYPDSHRYKKVGEKTYLIGVTTATGMVDKSRPLMIWAGRLVKDFILKLLKAGEPIDENALDEAINQPNVQRDEAAATGTLVHNWAEDYIKGLKPAVPEDERVKSGVLAFLRWVREHDVRFIASEKRVYSREHEYVGTMDCIFTMGSEGHKVVHAGDFKTSSGIYMEMAFQVSAYQHAESEEHGTKYGSKWILMFTKEDKFDKHGKQTHFAGEFKAKEFTLEEHEAHFRGFLACLELKKQNKAWEKEHGYYAKKKK